MTSQRELDRLLGAYFVEGTDELADRVIDAALDQIDHTPQRRALRIPWTFPTMNLTTRLAAVAVIGVIAIAGTLILVQRNQSSVAGPRPTTTPQPTATEAAQPSPTIPSASPTRLTGPLGTGRQIHTATLLKDGRVLIAGGYALGDSPLASAVLYDPSTNTFSPTGSLAEARGYHTATLLADGRVLITGGGPADWPGSLTGTTAPFLASAELYDPRTGVFSRTGSMATPREVHTATLLADGRVLITGGADSQLHSVASAELYDPKTGKFSPTGSMTTARAFQSATLLAGRVLIAGGSPAAWGTILKLASAEIYDPRTGTFTATGSMNTQRDFDTATLLRDGRVLIAGGSGLTKEDLPSAELYDPKTAKFSPTGSMTDGREYQTATLLADGRVLVAGGGSDYTTRAFLASAELYDPGTGTFTVTASLGTARTYQAATMLADGRVLLTGGYGAVAPLASAEIYDPTTGTFSPAG